MSPVNRSAAAGVIHDIGYQRYTGVRLGRAVRHPVALRARRPYRVRAGPQRQGEDLPVVRGRGPDADRGHRRGRPVADRHHADHVPRPRRATACCWSCCSSRRPRPSWSPAICGTRCCRSTSRDRSPDRLRARETRRAGHRGLLLILAAPMLVMFLGGAFSLDGAARGLARVHRLPRRPRARRRSSRSSTPSVALLIASLLRRRLVATAVIVGYFLVTVAIVGAVEGIVGGDTGENVGHLISPPDMVDGLKEWIFRVRARISAATGRSTVTAWCRRCTCPAIDPWCGDARLACSCSRYRKVAA